MRTETEYKGFAVVIKRAGIHGGYEASAYREDCQNIYSGRVFGNGAKAKAEKAIKQKIDGYWITQEAEVSNA
jgi:hypothetical protein